MMSFLTTENSEINSLPRRHTLDAVPNPLFASGFGNADMDGNFGDDDVVIRRMSTQSQPSKENTAFVTHRSVSGYIDVELEPDRTSTSNGEHFFDEHDAQRIENGRFDSTASMNNVFPYSKLGRRSSQPDLNVSVDRPEKVLSSLETYVVYRVVTRTQRPGFPFGERVVSRRYNDFGWLRQKLESEYPLCLIPPLPEKHSVYALDRFDPAFIRQRCFLLDLFMKSLVQHSALTRDPALKMFLICDFPEFNRYRKETSCRKPAADSWSNFAASLLTEVSHPEFDRYVQYAQSLGQKLQALDKMFVKTSKDDESLSESVTGLHVVMNHWAENEESHALQKPLHAFATAIDTWATTQDVWSSAYESSVFAPLRHWILYTDAVRHVLRRRDYLQMEEMNVKETVANKKIERDELATNRKNGWFISDSEVLRDQKKAKLTVQIEELQRTATKLTDQVAQANVELGSEMEQWLQNKDAGLRTWMASIAQQQVEYHKQCLSSWEKALETLLDGQNNDEKYNCSVPSTSAEAPL